MDQATLSVRPHCTTVVDYASSVAWECTGLQPLCLQSRIEGQTQEEYEEVNKAK